MIRSSPFLLFNASLHAIIAAMALTINGETIDDEVIETEFRQIKSHYERTLQVACCERDPEFMRYAKDNLITRTLIGQAAKAKFPDVTAEEVQQRLVKLKEEAGGEEQFYFKLGVPFADDSQLQDHVQGGVRVDKLLASIYGDEAEPTDAVLRAYYASHLDAFVSEEQLHVCHVTKGMEGAKSRADVYEAMRKLRLELTAGADFMSVAERERGNEQQQIDLGWFRRGEFMEEFETIAFSMAEGEISPVFMTPLGFHICRVMGRRAPAPVPFDDIKEAVRSRMIEEGRDSKFTAFVESTKAAATIDDSLPYDIEPGH
jgi:hypothetical protein